MEVSWLVLLLLLPGILAMKLHDVLTGRTRRELKDSLVSAAMYVLVVYGIVFLVSLAEPLGLTPIPMGVDFNPWTIACVLGVATLVGWLAGLADNRRWLLEAAKRVGGSGRGWRGAWLDSLLLRGRKKWVCVYLKDGTRILGWAKHFASLEEENTLFIAAGEHGNEPVQLWLTGRDAAFPVPGPGVLLAPAAEVSLLVFLEGQEERVWEARGTALRGTQA
jgi:hypothetical protein